MQVADLDGSVAAEGTNWKARVSILVQTGDGRPLPGANVQGAWGGGYTGTVSCWTANNGRCTVSTGRVPGQSATFTVTGLTKSGVTYQPAANHDPDGDSNGTTITIVRH
jgi:hypothetical protein